MPQTTAEEKGRICRNPDPHPGIIRLPVAPRVNHRIRFAPLAAQKPQTIGIQAALAMVRDLVEAGSRVDAVMVGGPGDPLADTELPLATIQAVKETFPDLRIVIKTLGIGGVQHADKFEKAGVSEVELLIDGVQQEILENIYAWVRPGFKTLQLGESLPILVDEQARAVQAFADAGIKVRIITTCYPTVNDMHLAVLARRLADLGADEMVLSPYTPSPDADIHLSAPTDEAMADHIVALSAYLPVSEGRPATLVSPPTDETCVQPKPLKERPNIAVVSSNGMEIDLHLGQAPQLLIYGPREDGLNCLLECRPTPSPGSGTERWDLLAETIPDCFALLTASAGDRPRRILDGHGIQVIISQDNIEGTVDTLYGGGKKGGCKKK